MCKDITGKRHGNLPAKNQLNTTIQELINSPNNHQSIILPNWGKGVTRFKKQSNKRS